MKEEILKLIPTENLQAGTIEVLYKTIDRLYQLGRLDIADAAALTIFANEFNKCVIISKKLAEGEPWEKDGKRSALIQISNNAANICLNIMKEFGLTAKSRKNLIYRDAKVAQTNNIIDEFND